MAKFKLEDGSEVEAFTADEVKERIDNEVAGLKAKRDELLGLHTKDKERLSELEEAQRIAEEERQKEKGEFKELYEKTQQELQQERESARKEREQRQTSDINSAAVGMSSKIAVDDGSAKLLAKEIKEYAKYSPEGVKYELGGVEVNEEKIIEHISKEYPRLIKGSGASGGGALGGSRNGQAVKKFNEYSGAELKAIKDDDPAQYERLKTDYYGK